MSFVIPELVQYFFLQSFLNRGTRILKFFSRCKFVVHHQLGFSPEPYMSNIQVEKENHDPNLSRSHLSFTNKRISGDESVRRDELELLMANLGFFCLSGGEKLPESLNSTDLLNIFEEEQPRLDEVKEAFDIFDENKDGFIDARELQRVLSALGVMEGADMEDCRKMIGAFDENADGRIDFNEFVKFMENTCC
ncbi:probable calcium-binding protein CML46 [Lactuca sativa]|uniref:EF-hand domain-containing protein n=1 Tax=Lactuca sativa TaxID=4236 RepID=A0A9R1WB52_LACSA|nr:probable calcium-binding protein CML46 [Lactuca sativa]KAJ0223387.1 hypothetical protein LSAT_V11C200082800 [Lactuca sativa]